MISSIVLVLVIGLVLAIVYLIGTKLPFMAGLPLQILGLVLALIWLLSILNAFGVLGHYPSASRIW